MSDQLVVMVRSPQVIVTGHTHRHLRNMADTVCRLVLAFLLVRHRPQPGMLCRSALRDRDTEGDLEPVVEATMSDRPMWRF